ncbi:MAG: hypothetical protein IPI63_00450 [Methanothrix sp.]|jgi:hypothetical protein|uniref:hypothetical protein n=1 Tax=Methanothrix sp. TaxID=90426 RepID=UPI001BD6DBCC|nr:hypothetical protein [Methanothrix sp.]MBK7385265.1 hypothetical protein [Methanothrix sp.]HRT16491.1 hypothetical protein [Methanothrix sp.]
MISPIYQGILISLLRRILYQYREIQGGVSFAAALRLGLEWTHGIADQTHYFITLYLAKFDFA